MDKTSRKILEFTIPILIIAISFVVLLDVILEPYSSYKKFYEDNQLPVSHILSKEYDIALWIKENANVKEKPNQYIVSDYGMSYILRGITGLNSSASVHPNMSYDDWESMQKEIREIFLNDITNDTYFKVNKIKNITQSDEIYFVLTKRTCWWLQQPNVLTIRYLPIPEANVYEYICLDIPKKLEQSQKFFQVFKNDEGIIYRYG